MTVMPAAVTMQPSPLDRPRSATLWLSIIGMTVAQIAASALTLAAVITFALAPNQFNGWPIISWGSLALGLFVASRVLWAVLHANQPELAAVTLTGRTASRFAGRALPWAYLIPTGAYTLANTAAAWWLTHATGPALVARASAVYVMAAIALVATVLHARKLRHVKSNDPVAWARVGITCGAAIIWVALSTIALLA